MIINEVFDGKDMDYLQECINRIQQRGCIKNLQEYLERIYDAVNTPSISLNAVEEDFATKVLESLEQFIYKIDFTNHVLKYGATLTFEIYEELLKAWDLKDCCTDELIKRLEMYTDEDVYAVLIPHLNQILNDMRKSTLEWNKECIKHQIQEKQTELEACKQRVSELNTQINQLQAEKEALEK